MVKSYSFSQNTLFLLVSYALEKVLIFFYFIFLARYLGPEEFGVYSFGISFIGIFFVFVDLGFSTVLIREAAKNKDKAINYLENAVTFKLIAAITTSLFVVLTINLLGYPVLTRSFVYLLIFWMFFESLGSTIYAFFRSQQNLRYEAIGFFLNKLIMIALGFVFIFLKLPLVYFAVPLVLGGIFYFFHPAIIVKKFSRLKLKIDKKIIKFFFKIALPILFGGIFATVFISINTVLVSFLHSDLAAGLFSAAFRIPMALLFLPGALGASIFPVFSSLVQTNKEKLAVIFEKVVFYMIFISLPLMVGGFILSFQIIALIYGSEFIGSVIPFIFLISVIPFLFLDYLFSSLLTALNKQKENAIFRGIGLFVNIVLCFLMIPRLAQTGGAISFSVGFLFFSILQLSIILRLVPINFSRIIKKTGLVLTSVLIMGIVIFVIRDQIALPFSLIVGTVVYGFGLYLFGAIKKSDLNEIKLLIRSSFKKEEVVKIIEKIEESKA